MGLTQMCKWNANHTTYQCGKVISHRMIRGRSYRGMYAAQEGRKEKMQNTYISHWSSKKQLDTSMARQRLKSPRSLSGTSAHPTMVTQVNIVVMNGWLTSFIVNRPPDSWDKAISGVWSKGKVIQSAQYHINSLPFHLTSIRPTIPQIELFRNMTFKHPRSRLWVRSKVKVTYCTQYPTNALPRCFTSIGATIPQIWPK